MTSKNEVITCRKLNLIIFLLSLSIIFIVLFAYLWYTEKKQVSFLKSRVHAFKSSEQIDRAHAKSWGDFYDTTLSNGNTTSIAFDFQKLMDVAGVWEGIADNNGNEADQVLVKLIRYDKDINLPVFGAAGTNKTPGRVSVCFYPFNKAKNLIIDDNTDDSRPLNLGDLHP